MGFSNCFFIDDGLSLTTGISYSCIFRLGPGSYSKVILYSTDNLVPGPHAHQRAQVIVYILYRFFRKATDKRSNKGKIEIETQPVKEYDRPLASGTSIIFWYQNL
jgi:hypothetical protein